MKKFTAFIFTLVLAFVLVGCQGENVASAEDYTIDKEVVIEEEVSFEEAKAKVESLEEVDTKYYTFESTTKAEGVDVTIKYSFIKDGDKINGAINVATKAMGASITVDAYIIDNYMLMEIPMVGKIKSKIPTSEDVEELFGDSSAMYEESLAMLTELLANNLEAIKAGFDKAGCLVIDCNNEGMKFRLVIDKAFPVYIYSEFAGATTEAKFSYEKVTIEYPEDLKQEDYKEYSWEDFNKQFGGLQ